ncbi:hypothetical protein BJ170DRAFT_473217 [Xylariales sp. AK1849]|nr:hypothetical protein BJ170DRAFT_473217 [Xylariales sp. AK1849]
MQRSNSTKSRGLGRRKSTTSVKSVQLSHIHPDTTERDAQVAATQAFARARERSATGAAMWSPPRRNERPTLGRHHSTPGGRSNGSVIRRQQSVRFVKPKTSQNLSEGGTAAEYTPTRSAGTTRFRVARGGIETIPGSSASAAGMVSVAKGAAGDYINALITGEDYYTTVDDVASAPSSYRRLRKSRSMFTSSGYSGMSGSHDQHKSSATLQRLPKPGTFSGLPNDDDIPPTFLKAPKSVSFLKSRQGDSSMLSVRRGSAPMVTVPDENISPATNKGGLGSSQSSMLFRPKSENPEKAFRKTLRDVSNGAMSVGLKIPKDRSLRNKARKVSQNFKHSLKTLFKIVKGENDDALFPSQHIEARKSHVVEMEQLEDHMEDNYPDSADREDAAFSRVTSGVPSLHAVPSEQQLRSRQGSLESLRSERKVSDEQSRVSSWTNSDTNTHGTINSHGSEWERQRLSVINEHGAHVSSSLTRRQANEPRWANPNNNVDKQEAGRSRATTTVDGQKIYSALMKRLDETQGSSQSINKRRQRSLEGFVVQGVVPLRSSSRKREGDGQGTPATIRHVVSGSSHEPDTSRTTSTTIHGSEHSFQVNDAARHMTALDREIRGRPITSSSADDVIDTTYHELDKNDASILSAGSQTTPYIQNKPQPGQVLSARSSAFFASPACHQFRTQSPYRKAIQGSMRVAAEVANPKSPEFNPWMRSLNSLPIRCPSACDSDVDKILTDAESIYSCEDAEPTSGSINTLSMVDKFPDPPCNHGDATIFLDPPSYRPIQSSKPSHRVVSSASSVEWKTWLSANVSKLEQSSLSIEHSSTSEDEPQFPKFPHTSGHVRESAQFSDEEDISESSRGATLAYMADNALMIKTNVNQSSALPRSILKTKHPTPFSDKRDALPNRPSIPFKGALRSTPSMEHTRPAREVCRTPTRDTEKSSCKSLRLKSLSHAPSLNALGTPAQDRVTITARLVKKQPRPQPYATSKNSPGIGAAVERQFGELGGSTGSKRCQKMIGPVKSENVSPRIALEDNDPYGIQDSGVLGPDADSNTQSMGSKHMVDLFLNSRRKRIASSEDADAFL